MTSAFLFPMPAGLKVDEPPPDAIPGKAAPRLHFLDGLRGWGALTVVLYHTFVDVFPVSGTAREFMWKIFLFNGLFAVAVFFLVSGVSLSVGFVRTPDRGELLKIGLGRYFRLTVPILIACLMAWAAARSGLTAEPVHRENAWSLIGVVRFAIFDVYAHNDPQHSPIPPLWTMPVELAGSAIVLILLAVVTRTGSRFAVYGAVAVLLWLRWPFLSAFVIGIAISEYLAAGFGVRAMHRRVMGPALIGLAVFAAIFLPPYSEGEYVAVAALFVFGVTNSSAAIAFLESGVSKWLGKISFPLYLLHSTVLFSLGSRLHAQTPGAAPWWIAGEDVLLVACCLAVASALAWIDQAGIQASRMVVRLALRLWPIKGRRATSAAGFV